MGSKLIIVEPGKCGYEPLEVPDPGANQVLCRTVLSGISHGTEMTAFLGTSPFLKKKFTPERVFENKVEGDPAFYPVRWVGYDAVAVIEKVGAGVTTIKPGQRVWYGANHQTHFPVAIDDPYLLPLHDSIPSDEAILLNLIAVAYTAVVDAQIKLGDVVAVVGGGAVGQFAAQLALLNGARDVYLIEIAKERREFAGARSRVRPIDPAKAAPVLQIKSQNSGRAPDVVIECSGSARGLHSAIQTAGLAGTVIAAGFYAGGTQGLDLSEEFLHNRVTMKASMGVWSCPSRFAERWDRPRIAREAVRILESRQLKLDGFVSGRFPFTQAQRAYESIRDDPGRYMKVALTYDM